MRFLTSPGDVTRSAPATVAVPESGSSSVVRMDTAVVLPAPLGPSSPRIVPFGTVRSRPSRATTSPYRLTSPRASMMSISVPPPSSKHRCDVFDPRLPSGACDRLTGDCQCCFGARKALRTRPPSARDLVANVQDVEFRILGPLEVVAEDRQVRVSGAKERALLAILLVHVGEVVSADRLIDELWGGELPANPSNTLQVVVSRLRKAMEGAQASERWGELLVTRKPGYVLDVDPKDLDARRFEQLVDEAGQILVTDKVRASSLLGEALGLWRGPALAEFAFEDFAQEEVARLGEARMRAVEMKMDADLALGRHGELVGELEALVAGNPLRERLRGQLMLALYRSGRQGEALRIFQEGRQALVDELGIDPGPANELRGAGRGAPRGKEAAGGIAFGDPHWGRGVRKDQAGHRGGRGAPRGLSGRRVAGGAGGRQRPRPGVTVAGLSAGDSGGRVTRRGRASSTLGHGQDHRLPGRKEAARRAGQLRAPDRSLCAGGQHSAPIGARGAGPGD